MKNILSVIVASLFVAACVAGGGSGSTAGNTGNVVSVSTPEAFKSKQDVVVGGFMVGFAVKKTDTAKAGGGLMGSGFGGKTLVKSTLTGVDDAAMQAITDEAYKNFIAKLKSQGFNVVDRAQLINHAKFSKTKTYPNPYEDTQGGMLGGGDTTKYFAPSSFGGVRIFMGDISGTTGGIGFDNPSTGAAGFAEDTQIPVITAKYYVDFANADKYGGFHTNSSSISVDQGISINPEVSRVMIVGGHSGTFSKTVGTITLKHALASDKKFAEIEDVTGGGYKAVQVATNVIGVLGGVGSNKSTLFEFKANPSAFKEGTLDSLEKANDTFVGKMANLR